MSEYVLLSDIHGNAPALQAVVDKEGEDAEYIILGDLMGLLAYPKETMSLLNKMEPKVLLAGNHDKAIFHKGEGHVNSDELSQFELQHTLSLLSDKDCEFISNLPFMEVWKDGPARIAAAHAIPWPEQASGYEQGNAGVDTGAVPHVASVVSNDYDIVLLGHTHEQYDLDAARWGHPVHFVNPGSLGWDNTYSVVDTETGEVTHKNVESTNDEVKEHVQSLLPEDAPHTGAWF